MHSLAAHLLCLVLALPAAAPAQTHDATGDLNAMPRGRSGAATGDPQADAQAAYREAQARCRKVTPKERSDCVAQAMRDQDRVPRTRRPSVEVRPASTPAAGASSASSPKP